MLLNVLNVNRRIKLYKTTQQSFIVAQQRHLVHQAGDCEIKGKIAESSCKTAVKLRVTVCKIYHRTAWFNIVEVIQVVPR